MVGSRGVVGRVRGGRSVGCLGAARWRGAVVVALLLVFGAAGASAGWEQVAGGAGRGRVAVRFTYRPPARAQAVHLAGSFNEWSVTATPMADDDGDGVWTTTLDLPAGGRHEYKFVLDGVRWELDPDNPRQTQGLYANSLLELDLAQPESPWEPGATGAGAPAAADDAGDSGTSRAPATPMTAALAASEGARGDAPPAAATARALVPVAVEYRHPEAARVELFWGVDGWQGPAWYDGPAAWRHADGPVAVAMERGEDGVFRAAIPAPPGTTLDFVFHVLEPFDWWDNNGGDGIDYHATVPATGAAAVWVTSGGAASAEPATTLVEGYVAPRLGERIGPTMVGAAWLRHGALGAALLAAAALLWRAARGATPRGAGGPGRVERLLAVAGIALLAWCVRAPHVARPDPEIDELDYVPLSQGLATLWGEGDWAALVDVRHVFEHPRGALMLHAAAIRAAGAEGDFVRATLAARREAVALAVAAVALLAWRWPLAALLLSLAGLSVKYTSLVYLDAATLLFGVACVLLFDAAVRAARWRAAEWPSAPGCFARWAEAGPGWRTLGLLKWSALAAGATVSSKYLGAVAPLAVAAGFVLWWATAPRGVGARRWIAALFAGYVVLAVAAMIAADPSLWSRDLPARLGERLMFHRRFSTSELVVSSDFPWYQPVVWLWTFTAAEPSVGWVGLDRGLTLFGLGGIALLLWREPRLGFASVVALVFLFLWPTKWPQYVVVLLPWLAVGAESVLTEAAVLGGRAARAAAARWRGSGAG